MKFHIKIILALLVLLTLASCGRKAESSTSGIDLEKQVQDINEALTEKDQIFVEDDVSYWTTLKVEISPFLNAQWLNKQRGPLKKLLEKELDQDVEISLGQDYSATIEALKNGEIHLALLSPSQYVLAQDFGAKAILRTLSYEIDKDGDIDFEKDYTSSKYSQLITKKDSDIKSLADLKGKRLAVANYLSTTGFILPLNLLTIHGLNPTEDIEWVNVGSHDKAVEAVYYGDVDAAFTYKDARTLFKSKLKDIFETTRVVLVSDPLPSDVVAVAAGIDEEYIEALKEAFLNLSSSEKGRDAIYNIYQWTDFIQVNDEDYSQIKAMIKRHEREDF